MPEGPPEGTLPVGTFDGVPEGEPVGIPERPPFGMPEGTPLGMPDGRRQFWFEVPLSEDDESPEPQAASNGESASRATAGTSRARRFMR